MSDELELFPGSGTGDPGGRDEGGRWGGSGAGSEGRGGREAEASLPLAARMRPATLDQVRGQDHLLGPDRPLGRMLEGGELSSCILWGPPGSGKTTLARLLAQRADAAFVSFSAVTEGVARVREIIAEARTRLRATGRRTILFCDEIHRFNRAQQDAFLPHVEDGTVILVGATTENPSFEVNRPLLSRAPVFILEPLGEVAMVEILREALADLDRGLGARELSADEAAVELLAKVADGDARRALGALEAAARLVEKGGTITEESAREALQHRFAIYDRSGEEHYNLISAFHKSIRGGDPDGALYWLARMVRGGEDPMYLARRLVRMASEDIGLADPGALEVAVAAWRAYHFLGKPEGELALAEAAVYLATAPKSNRVYSGWNEALDAAEATASAPVPMHLRNAATELMEEWGYGEGYRYDPDEPEGVARQRYLPEVLGTRRFYRPGDAGAESAIGERLARWERVRGRPEGGVPEGEGDEGRKREGNSGPGGHPPGDRG
jgi:putative ATPase